MARPGAMSLGREARSGERDLCVLGTERPAVGRYRIEEALSIRSGSIVFKAFDPDLQRAVVLKIYSGAPGATDSNRPSRILSEARALVPIDSAQVAKCYNIETTCGTRILVNEWVEGQPLDFYLANHRLGYREVCGLARALVLGLEAIHGEGLLLRDLKPSNVIIGADRQPKSSTLDWREASTLRQKRGGLAPELLHTWRRKWRAAVRLPLVERRTSLALARCSIYCSPDGP